MSYIISGTCFFLSGLFSGLVIMHVYLMHKEVRYRAERRKYVNKMIGGCEDE